MATKKEQAQELMSQVMDREVNDADRRKTLDDLTALKKSAKTSWEKLGISEAMYEREMLALEKREAMQADLDEADPLKEEPAADPLDEKPAEEAKSNLTSMVHELLIDTEMSYSAIVEAVKAKFPEAKTTNRSVASVACDLRKDGIAVPSRRIKKKA